MGLLETLRFRLERLSATCGRGMEVRLQKWMADAGVASRRRCEEMIRAGRVSVNGQRAELGCTVDEGDIVEMDGKRIAGSAPRLAFAFYKPRGVLCSAEDARGRKCVNDFFRDVPCRLYNVGRLDYNSEGLLIMTNDGELAYRMTHPKFGLEKTYHVVCDALFTDAQLAAMEAGVLLEDGMSAPARLANPRRLGNGHFAFELTIHEGRKRQVRRMVEAMGRKTLRLQRTRLGNITLAGLRPGGRRELTKEEVIELYRLCK